jgi:hypothetical protein
MAFSVGVNAPSGSPNNASRNATARPGRPGGAGCCEVSATIAAMAFSRMISDNCGSRRARRRSRAGGRQHRLGPAAHVVRSRSAATPSGRRRRGHARPARCGSEFSRPRSGAGGVQRFTVDAAERQRSRRGHRFDPHRVRRRRSRCPTPFRRFHRHRPAGRCRQRGGLCDPGFGNAAVQPRQRAAVGSRCRRPTDRRSELLGRRAGPEHPCCRTAGRPPDRRRKRVRPVARCGSRAWTRRRR